MHIRCLIYIWNKFIIYSYRLYYREVEEKNSIISSLEDRLREETAAATQDAIQKADANLRTERDRREKAEIALANLQKNLQNMEMQHSEYISFHILYY